MSITLKMVYVLAGIIGDVSCVASVWHLDYWVSFLCSMLNSFVISAISSAWWEDLVLYTEYVQREDSISSLHVNIVYKTLVEFMSIEGVNSTSSLVSNLWLKGLFTNVSWEFYSIHQASYGFGLFLYERNVLLAIYPSSTQRVGPYTCKLGLPFVQ